MTSARRDQWGGDVWSTLDAADDEVLGQFRGLLELRSEDAQVIAAQARLFELLGLKQGDRVLELGTGLGQAAVAASERVSPGAVVAADNAKGLIEAARAAAKSGSIEWLVADARKTGLPDKSFDAVFAVDLAAHVGPLEALISEAKRLLKPAGRLGFLEYAPPLAYLPDSHYFQIGSERFGAQQHDPLAGARLGAAMTAAGFREVRTETSFASWTDVAEGTPWALIQDLSGSAVEAGALDSEERDEWLNRVAEAGAAGECLFLIPMFLAVGKAPGIALRRA